MYQYDATITHWINGWAGWSGMLDAFMRAASAVGIPVLVLAVAGQWWRRDEHNLRHVLVSAGLSFALGLAFNQVILLFLHRVRPYDLGVTNLLIQRSADPSFPSDHATAGMAIAAAFLLHGRRGQGTVFLLASVLVAVSRVFLGTHYFSDVLGGAATGLIAAWMVRALYREGSRVDRLLTDLL